MLSRIKAWANTSGLSPDAEAVAHETIARVLPYVMIASGVVAFAGASVHILFLEAGFRPLLLPGHALLIVLGLFWRARPPTNLNAATFFVAFYLAGVMGIYMLSGQLNSAVHFGILIVGSMYLSLDRRLVLAQSTLWLAWLAIVSVAWLPNDKGLSVIVISAISAVGGIMLRQLRIAGINEVTELRRQLQETNKAREAAISRAQEAEKLESLGIMAAGVAHDYNNLLVGVVGGVDLATYAKTERDRTDALATIRTSAESLRRLSAQILELAGGRPMVKQQVDINQVVNEVVRVLTSTDAANRARVQCDLDEGDPCLHGELESIEQITMNLVTNALEAATHKPGAVQIGTRHALDARSVLIWVADDGPGVATGLTHRIFDPFFTTRENGRGLGLATVRTMVQRHDGEISIKPSKRGARFEVLLPVHPVEPNEIVIQEPTTQTQISSAHTFPPPQETNIR